MTATRKATQDAATRAHLPRPVGNTGFRPPQDNASRDLPADVSAALRAAREARGWSLRRTARELGTDAAYVLRLERGERRPSVRMAEQLVEALRLDWIAADRLLEHAVSGVGRSAPWRMRRPPNGSAHTSRTHTPLTSTNSAASGHRIHQEGPSR